MAEPYSAKGSIVSPVNRIIEATPLTAADWSPFGWIPLRDTDPRDGEARLQFEWSDVHVNLISHLGRVPWIFVAESCRSVRCLID
jgi:hypothetical protein